MTDGNNSFALTCAFLLLVSPSVARAQTASASATVETEPVPSSGDAADDPVVWVHPTDPSRSTVIGTDKQSGLAVYDLAGNELQFLSDGELNNVDLRHNFPLGAETVALVTAGERGGNALAIYAVDPDTRLLRDVAAGTITFGIAIYGSCMYRSPVSGEYYFFGTSKEGDVEQWRLFDDGSGAVDAVRVRTLSVGGQLEGCAADDESGYVFIGEEAEAIWRYGAEPNAGNDRIQVDTTGSGGHLTADVEGITIFYASGGAGYLIVSSQGNNTFVVYERRAPHQHLLTFALGTNSALGIDGCSDTDGIDVTSRGLGAAFPGGLFVAQDGANSGGNQNFKLVPWPAIAELADPPLIGGGAAGDPPLAAFTASASGADPLQIAFTDHSTGNVTGWTWDFGDGAGSGVQNPVHVYAEAGDYAVVLTVSGPDGSSSTEDIVAVDSGATGGGGDDGGGGGGGCAAALGPNPRGGDPSLALSLALVLVALASRRARLAPRDPQIYVRA